MEIPFTVKERPDTGLFNSKVGIWLFLASEVMLFGGLFSGYVFLRLGADYPWPIHALKATMPLGATNTAVLIASSVFVVMAWTALKLRRWREFQVWMGLTVLCAAAFCVIKSKEYASKFHHYALVLKDGTELHGHLAHEEEAPGDHYRFLSLEEVEVRSFLRLHLNVNSLLEFNSSLAEQDRRLFDSRSYVLGNQLQELINHSQDKESLVEEILDGLIHIEQLNGELSKDVLLASRDASLYLTRRNRQEQTLKRAALLRNQNAATDWREAVAPKDLHEVLLLHPREEAKIAAGEADENLEELAIELELTRAVFEALATPAVGEDAFVIAKKEEKEGAAPIPSPIPNYHFAPRLAKPSNLETGYSLYDGYVLLGELPEQQYIYLHTVDVIDLRRVGEGYVENVEIEDTFVYQIPELRQAWLKHWNHIQEKEEKRGKDGPDGIRVERPFSDYHRYAYHILKNEDVVHFSSPEATGESKDASHTYLEDSSQQQIVGATEESSLRHGIGGGGGAGITQGGAHWLRIPRSEIKFSSYLTPRFNTFYSIYYLMTGLHALHVIGGAIVLAYFLFFGKKLYDKDPEHMANRVEVGGLFWHFVDLVWIFLFPLLYLL